MTCMMESMLYEIDRLKEEKKKLEKKEDRMDRRNEE